MNMDNPIAKILVPIVLLAGGILFLVLGTKSLSEVNSFNEVSAVVSRVEIERSADPDESDSQTVYVKYTPADGYVLKNFTSTSNGTSTNFSHTDNVGSFTMPAYDTSVVANVMLQHSVTYYVDMHDNNVSSLSVAICSQGWATVLKDSNNNDCSHTLERQGSSSVYAYSINTPVTQTNGTYSDLYIRVTFNGTNYNTINVPGTKVATLVSTHEM